MEQPTPKPCSVQGSRGVGWLWETCLLSHSGGAFVELGKGCLMGLVL